MEIASNGSVGVDDATITAVEEWEIIHVPNKPLVPPHLQPTVNVVAAVIEPKYANTIVRKLNQIAPLENLRHVKRVRKKCLDGGVYELSVILRLAPESESLLDGMPDAMSELIERYQFANMLHQRKKNGKHNASIGQHPFILPHTTSLASLDLVTRIDIQFLPS